MKALGRSALVSVACAMVLACGGVRAEPGAANSFSGLVAEREPGTRLCIDMDGHFFVWQWGNVPFASSCIENGPKKVSTAAPAEACYFACSNTWLSCQTSVLDGDPPKTCLDGLTACMARCKGGSDSAARQWLGPAP